MSPDMKPELVREDGQNVIEYILLMGVLVLSILFLIGVDLLAGLTGLADTLGTVSGWIGPTNGLH